MSIKVFKITAVALILAGSFCSCGKQESASSDNPKDGILPSSINQVVDVFELKYKEVKECTYNGQILKFSLTDIDDKLLPRSASGYMPPDSAVKIRIHAFLRVEIGSNVNDVKVSSQQWGPYEYQNDGEDIQHIWVVLEDWQFRYENLPLSFKDTFFYYFGEGTLLNKTPFSIYMAKAYPFAYKMNGKPEKSRYKFIFIITNQKSKN